MPNDTKMTEHERQVYKKHMKAIRDALREGNKEKADRIAENLKQFFGVE